MGSHHRMADVLALRLPDVYQFATLTVLAHHWNQATGLTFPSVHTICKESGMTERKVQYALRELEAAGLILAIGSTKGGRSKSVKYQLHLPSTTGKGAHAAPFLADKGCTDGAERVHALTIKGAHLAPEPLMNHLNRSASAPAPEARAPRRPRPPEPGESPEARRARELMKLAADLGWHQEVGEDEGAYVSRIDQRNQQRMEDLP